MFLSCCLLLVACLLYTARITTYKHKYGLNIQFRLHFVEFLPIKNLPENTHSRTICLYIYYISLQPTKPGVTELTEKEQQWRNHWAETTDADSGTKRKEGKTRADIV